MNLEKTVVGALEDLKARDIVVLNVGDISTVAETMVIASGTSNRHVKALADNAAFEAKQQGRKPIGVEGADVAEWVLVDFGDLIVHVMLPHTRAFYDLESLWTLKPNAERAKQGDESGVE
ncbi:MAG: ribosome silencing factor [Gammaproteobacteria bacterium]|nr:ribosome silencing factor [Gammaproteobacteria bacterium]MBT8151836.1 ribosome silencing factor [Gammaproteobacteria bacterium]NND39191.1 ribosome silencing factor [Pseudomonadales bacterium]NNM11703.1 ribosome silencing factor [Pseudomonadales bacterium]RZV53956.1 MAG: ribosome silencing factor [Pseudomonadales bacterium]